MSEVYLKRIEIRFAKSGKIGIQQCDIYPDDRVLQYKPLDEDSHHGFTTGTIRKEYALDLAHAILAYFGEQAQRSEAGKE